MMVTGCYAWFRWSYWLVTGYGWLWVGKRWLQVVAGGYEWLWVVKCGYGVISGS